MQVKNLQLRTHRLQFYLKHPVTRMSFLIYYLIKSIYLGVDC